MMLKLVISMKTRKQALLFFFFAEDMSLLSRGPSVEKVRDLASVDFNGTKLWFIEKKLLLNEDKTQKNNLRSEPQPS